MIKRYQVQVIDPDSAEDKSMPGKVKYNTDTQTVEIVTSHDNIIMTFDTLEQLYTQLQDIKNYGANDAAQKGK